MDFKTQEIGLDVVNSDAPSASPSIKASSQDGSCKAIEIENRDCQIYLRGWRLHVLSLSVALCMFLVNIEVSVVGTSFVSIIDDLHGFQEAEWVVTGYLVTYTSMLIIWTKISDISGRKPAIIASSLIFVIFSGGCGASQTMAQLITNRVFQGIGAAGCVSVALVIGYEMVPKDQYPALAAKIASASALGSLVGPLIGGGVSERSTWRWVFLLNVPAGLVTIMLLVMSMSTSSPRRSRMSCGLSPVRQRFCLQSLSRLDLSGAFLLVGATMLLVTVLLEASTDFAWGSSVAMTLLVASAVLWILFLVNERILTSDLWRAEPIFPWRFLFNRAWMGILLLSLLSGVPYNVLVINIPQRFQVVYGLSPLGAGLRLIPFNLSITLGCVAVNLVAAKTHILPITLLLVGSTIQLIGLILFSTLSSSRSLLPETYGWEALSGCGIGIVMGMLIVMPPHVVENRDLAISSGALLQFRVFGGTLGLAIASSVMNSHLTSNLSTSIGAQRLSELLKSVMAIKSFPAEIQGHVLESFASGYILQLKIMTGLACIQVFAIGLLWRKRQISVVEKEAA